HVLNLLSCEVLQGEEVTAFQLYLTLDWLPTPKMSNHRSVTLSKSCIVEQDPHIRQHLLFARVKE
ncbi:hypothetical protein NP569_26650, partial [Vibrio parahaemolyticus]|nr:hypothetical protein [Vibrio parahaemolyticus]